MFCIDCGKSKVEKARFCYNCGKDFRSEPPQPLCEATDINVTVENAEQKPRQTINSFQKYRSEKGSQWKKFVSQKSTTQHKVENQAEVVIFIGMLKLKDSELKVIRGKRLSLRVFKNDSPAAIRIKAENKWKGYYPNLYNEDDFYNLTYECGRVIETLPGSTESFTLHRYKEELGKDYKRITLFLCSEDDIKIKVRINAINYESSDNDDNNGNENMFGKLLSRLENLESISLPVNSNCENFFQMEEPELSVKKKQVSSSTISSAPSKIPKISLDEDDYGDEEVKKFFNVKPSENITENSNMDAPTVHELPELTVEEISVLSSYIKKFEDLLKEKPNSLILIQRNRNKFWNTLFRNDMDFATHVVRVMFAGECAVDSGGPFREFLQLAMKYFPEAPSMIFGSPMECFFTADASCCFQKKYFLLGQLSAVSILFW